jgi:hypothetical protein
MTRRVRTELDTSAREFSNYRRVSNQMLTEGFEEIGRQAEKNGEEIRKVIEAISKEAIIPIQEAATKLSSIIEDHNRSVTDQAAEATRKLTETTDKLSTIIDKFGVAVEGVGTRLGEIRKPEDVIRLELTPTVEAIKDMTDAHLRRMEEGIAETRSQATKVDEALKPLNSRDRKLDRIAEALERQAEPRSSSTADTDNVVAAVSDQIVADATSSTLEDVGSAPTGAGAEPKRRLFRW